MSRKSAERKFAREADPHQAELVKLMKQFGYSHQTNTVFADFVEMAALAISNSVDKAQFNLREKRYLEIVGKYKRDEVQLFARMFAELALSFEHRLGVDEGLPAGSLPCPRNLTDVLGETYMMLDIGNDRAGQFFTPYHVSRLMAGIAIGGRSDAIEQDGFMRMQEPACGAGGMVIATADALLSIGQNYQETMHATCIDIDPRCVYMTYLQLSMMHIPAVIVHGNALTLEVWGMWYTPAHILGGWRTKLRQLRQADALRELLALERSSVASDAGAEPVRDGKLLLAEDVDSVTDVEEPAAAMRTSDDALCDLFDAAVAESKASIFNVVDQLALF
ncbi:type I restriction endonuclease subunit M [Burkholderia vietnamiensis]|uniref:N-6 DNA methylase n=1 Tax=Burkholderia vietnamiensis TaxID=60552 RepID=UPI0006214930|nr:N-6 DNA methylase [Burkholderia vietnamiensis]KKI39299.1 type I restriction endonuclease subunit M [Burkholderia vietnamiensis]TPQ36204.1 SAM-dependent DNA methyltransferase [Burkholderia ubonensis]HDR9086012.1 SAM-dependent DNA methyltransferase [Burkholderia vietnamiensis]